MRGLGWSTVGIDRRESSSADQHLVADLGEVESLLGVSEALRDLDVDALINNAGVGSEKTLDELSVGEWNEVMTTNLAAPWQLGVALLPSLRSNRGAVVNVSSVHAVASGIGTGAYAVAKAGLVALTRAMAIEWGPAVRVNTVLPGPISTPMLAGGLERVGIDERALGERHPLRRVGSPEEVARAIHFLLDGATYSTGACLVVDGGALTLLATEVQQ